jgi:Tol biopolymer transport system component
MIKYPLIIRFFVMGIFITTSALPANTVSANTVSTDAQVITPQNVPGLKLLASIGQGAYSGTLDLQPGGRLIAAVTTSGIALLDSGSGKQSGFIPLGFEATALSISPDGKTLAALYNVPTGKMMQDSTIGFNGPDYERTIALFSLPEGRQIGAEITELQACSRSNVWQIAFAADGKSLIFEKKYGDSKADSQKLFCRISLASGKIEASLEIPANADTTLSPDGRFAAVIQRDQDDVAAKAVIFETGTFKQLVEISFSPVKWPGISFTRRGDFVLRYSKGEGESTPHIVQFWSLPDGKPFLTLEETEHFSYVMPDYPGNENTDPNDRIMSEDISPDGRWAATGSQNGKVKLWDAKTGKLIKELGVLSWMCHSLTGNPDGIHSAEMNSYVTPVAFSSDGKTLVAAEYLTVFGQSGQIHVYQLPDGVESAVFAGDGAGNDGTNLAFSPDSSRIAYGGFADHSTQVFDVSDGKQTLLLAGHTALVNQVKFSPDGKLIATASDDNTIRLWDAESGKSARELRGHSARVNQIAFSPDGQWLVSGADDNTIRRWKTADGSLIDSLTLKDGNWRIEVLEAMPDGRSVLYTALSYPSPLTGYNTRQMLWNPESGAETEVGGGKVTITALGNDGTTFIGYTDNSKEVGLLEGDGKMTLIAGGIRSPYGNGALVGHIVTPDRRLLIMGNGFGLQAWELTGSSANFLSIIAAGEPFPGYTEVDEISPDGKIMAFASGGVVYLLGVPLE